MLKLSSEIKGTAGNKLTETELNQACKEAVSSIVRPALIDLVEKLEKDRKTWFHRILSPVANSIRLLAGRPAIDPSGLISASLQLGAGMAIELTDHAKKVKTMKGESGLAYLIELHKQFNDHDSSAPNDASHHHCAHIRHVMYKMKDTPSLKKLFGVKSKTRKVIQVHRKSGID